MLLSQSQVGPECGPSQCWDALKAFSLLPFCKMNSLLEGLVSSAATASLVSTYKCFFFWWNCKFFYLSNFFFSILLNFYPQCSLQTQLKAVSSAHAIVAWRLGCPENSSIRFSLLPLSHGQNIDKFFAIARHKWPLVQFQESSFLLVWSSWSTVSTLPTLDPSSSAPHRNTHLASLQQTRYKGFGTKRSGSIMATALLFLEAAFLVCVNFSLLWWAPKRNNLKEKGYLEIT